MFFCFDPPYATEAQEQILQQVVRNEWRIEDIRDEINQNCCQHSGPCTGSPLSSCLLAASNTA